MSRITLWNPVKGNDFNFIDKAIGENMRIAGDSVLTHMYLGPTTDSEGNTKTDITTIQDVLFLANNSRKYDPNVFELRGHYQPTDVNFDLSQFGIFLSSDTLRIFFHYQDMVDTIGRKLIAGDVLEFPNMRDTPVGNDVAAINRFYVVQDALWAANGYGPKWFPHIWLVKAQLMTASPEFQPIIDQSSSGATAGGVGENIGIMPEGWANSVDSNGNPISSKSKDIKNSLSLLCKYLNITDQVIKEAEDNVFFDPVFFQSANLYVYLDENKYPCVINYMSGMYMPPNGAPLAGIGVKFPNNMQDGEYYLRTDYHPERLFQKQGNCFKYIEENLLRTWTAYNKVLDSYIQNNNVTVMPNGETFAEKQPISTVVQQKVDLYAEAKKKVTKEKAEQTKVANKRASCSKTNQSGVSKNPPPPGPSCT